MLNNIFTKGRLPSIEIEFLSIREQFGRKKGWFFFATPTHLESSHVRKQYVLCSTSMALDSFQHADAIFAMHANLRRRICAEVTYCNNENFELTIVELRKEISGRWMTTCLLMHHNKNHPPIEELLLTQTLFFVPSWNVKGLKPYWLLDGELFQQT